MDIFVSDEVKYLVTSSGDGFSCLNGNTENLYKGTECFLQLSGTKKLYEKYQGYATNCNCGAITD
ncbi:MAG: hypothetical protein D3917_03645 [Candidatus Electrothrix sp. AX5]|jgi:hypothetical protein|nr:hypothetical protein [Candidatus Electrothrix sp. AX5]